MIQIALRVCLAENMIMLTINLLMNEVEKVIAFFLLGAVVSMKNVNR